MKTDTHFWSYLAQFFIEWEMFQTKVVEEIKTHIFCSVTFNVITFIASLLWGYTTAARDVTNRAYRTAETWRHAQPLQLPVEDNTTPAPDDRKRDVCFTE